MPLTPIAASLAAALLAAPAPVPDTTSAASATVSWSVVPSASDGPDGRSWIERDLDPGDSVTEHLAVRNLGSQDAVFALSAADGYFTDTGRFTMLPAGEESSGAGTWISIPQKVDVAAGDTAIVPFTIAVPGDAAAGDHAAGVAASVLSTGVAESGTAVEVESRVGFRVVTTVTGSLRADIELSDVGAVFQGAWNPFAPGTVEARYTATNTGNVQIEYADRVDGEPVARGDLLPGESREGVAAGTVWPLLLVPVTVSVTADAGDAAAPATATHTVWVWAVPWSQLLTLSGLALIALALFAGRRRSARRVDRLVAEAREEGRRSAVG